MKNTNILVVLFILFSTFAEAQTYFKPGYVIKSEGDTLFGEVDYRGSFVNSKVCTFRHNAKDSIRHFSPDDIIGYRFRDSKYYISKMVDGKKVFLEFLINGRVNIYYLKDKWGEDHYYIEKEGLGFAQIPYKEGIKERDGQEYLYSSTRHIGLLTYYMQDAKGLETEILKLKKPEHDNLIALAKDYHNAVCNGDKCIIYEKKLPLFKVGFELVGGQIYINDVFFGKYNFPQVGIMAHIWMPLVNENLFLKVGVLYPVTKLEFKLNDALLTPSAEFPFQIEYVYPHGIFRPKFAIGTNFPYISLDLSPGVDIRLAKWLFLTVNYNAGLYPGNYGAPFQLRVFSQSISTGLLLKL
jgi:hypothetical protein